MIDVDRCRRGMESITVGGAVTPGRLYLIEEAIARIQSDPDKALGVEYLGIKNYASFGDQREDHTYGSGPRHGSIVFSIRRREREVAPNVDAIYLLECVRDFGVVQVTIERTDGYDDGKRLFNLCDVIRRHDIMTRRVQEMASLLAGANVECHDSVTS